MPVEIGIWRMGAGGTKVPVGSLDAENRLEEMLADDIGILSPDLMLLGRQVSTSFGKFIDLLAIDGDGNLHVIELKRDRTPRDVVAQTLDYGSWIQTLSHADVMDIFQDKNPGLVFEEAFEEQFGTAPPEELNREHELVVVASELDSATERIIDYLTENFGVPINAVFFRYFKDGDHEYLVRSWLLDPAAIEPVAAGARKKTKKETWNGRDYYVTMEEGDHRTWDDAVRFGFVSAGGSKWFTQRMNALKPGHRIFVNVPPKKYVGVGEVVEEAVPVNQFMVDEGGAKVPILEAKGLKATKMDEWIGNDDECERLVRVKWIETKPTSHGYWEKGLFANQQPACKLRNQFTLEKLVSHFELEDD